MTILQRLKWRNKKKLEWHHSEYQRSAHFVSRWNHPPRYLETIIWSREQFLSSLHHIDAFPSFVFVFQRGVRVREPWNQESVETKRKHLEWTQRSCLITERYLTRGTWMKAASRRVSVLGGDTEVGCLLLVGEAPGCEGGGNAGCPAWNVDSGRVSRRTRPRWMSGQHLFHLLAGSYQQKCCHTHWMRKGHS